jgi:uncharacterized membrane protein YGL010W
MKTLTEHLANYAGYHRHVRNIQTHFVGIPLIVLSFAALLAGAAVNLGGVTVSLAMLAWLLSSIFYLRLDLRYGIVMTVLMAGAVSVGHQLAAMPLATWLGWSIGVFVVGWIIQFIGHYYEGRKPAFVDDIAGLIVGPLFVVAEAGFLLGMRKEVQAQVEAVAGPVRNGPQALGQAAR